MLRIRSLILLLIAAAALATLATQPALAGPPVLRLSYNSLDNEGVRVSHGRIVWYGADQATSFHCCDATMLAQRVWLSLGASATWLGDGDEEICPNAHLVPDIDRSDVVWIHRHWGNYCVGGTDRIELWRGGAVSTIWSSPSGPIDELSLHVADGRVVWAQYGSVYMWDGAAVTVLAQNSAQAHNYLPETSGGGVIWLSRPQAGGLTLWYYTGGQAVELAHDVALWSPDIDHGTVVWAAGATPETQEIYIRRNGVTQQLTSNAYRDDRPRVCGNNLVWVGYPERHGGAEAYDAEIYWYDGTTTRRLTNDADCDSGPVVDAAGNIAWVRGGGESLWWAEMYARSATTGSIYRLTTNDFDDVNPQISDGLVVWEGATDRANWDVYACPLDGAYISPITLPTSPYPSGIWGTASLIAGQTHAHYKAERKWGLPLANDLTPNSLAQFYRAAGYSFVAATEHYPQYPLWTDSTQPNGIARLHCCMEDTCATHVLGLGFDLGRGWPPPDTCPLSLGDRVRGVTQAGGVAVVAHPNEAAYRWVPGWASAGPLTGVEVYNRGTDLLSYLLGRDAHNPYALDVWDWLLSWGKQVWGFAGDDFTLPWPQFDGGCVVAVLPSQTADQYAIMGALKSGAFYASKGGWKGGLGAPKTLGYWADAATSTIHLVAGEPAQVWFTTAARQQPRTPSQRPDGSWEATFTYSPGDKYVRATAVRPLVNSISWTQPIFIERLGMQTFTWPAFAKASAGKALAPVTITFEGATLELAQPQSQVANVTASLVPIADRPAASPPMGYIGPCYRFLPQAQLDGTNTLTVQYNPDDVLLFPEHTLSIYWYDTDNQTWTEMPSAVDTNTHTVVAGITKLGTFTLSAPRPDELNAPNVSITSPANGAVLSGPATITATANDDSGVAGVSFYLDSILLDKDIWPADGWSCTADFSRYPNGAHTIKAVAEDACENQGTAQIPVSITGGTPPPAVSISSPAAGTTFWGRIDASGAYADDQEGLELVLGLDDNLLGVPAMNAGQWTFAGSIPPAISGAHNLVIGGRDADGNPVGASVLVKLRVFADVVPGSAQDPYIYAIARAGITGGCLGDPPRYCPFAGVTRAQMAKFLCIAAGKPPLNRDTPTFADVPKTNIYYGYVERLADAASWGATPPTGGCRIIGTTKYFCPYDPVTREQMAKFLCIAAGKSPMPSCAGTFGDVTSANTFCRFIERLTDAPSWPGGLAVTSGCAAGPPPLYCPKSNVTRGQMAVFLVRAFGIPL